MLEGWKICNFYFVVTENKVNVLICACCYRSQPENQFRLVFSQNNKIGGLIGKENFSQLYNVHEKIVYRQILF